MKRSDPPPSLPSLAAEIGKSRPFDSPEQEAYLNILRTASLLTAPFEALFKQHGLSESTYNALRILRGATLGPDAPGKRPCHEIGQYLIARVPDVTRLIDRLELAGFVERSRCNEDRRVVYVGITRRGLDLLARLDQPMMDLHARQLAHMGRRELADLSRLLVKARSAGAEGSAEARSERKPQ